MWRRDGGGARFIGEARVAPNGARFFLRGYLLQRRDVSVIRVFNPVRCSH
jgi:hypothetical protein